MSDLISNVNRVYSPGIQMPLFTLIIALNSSADALFYSSIFAGYLDRRSLGGAVYALCYTMEHAHGIVAIALGHRACAERP